MNKPNIGLKLIVEMGILILVAGMAWATLYDNVADNKEACIRLDKKIEVCEDAISSINLSMREISISQGYISRGVDDIKRRLEIP